MEIQQSTWFEYNRRSQETFRPDPQRTHAGDEPIQNAEIGCAPAAAIHDQKLMFNENGLGKDRMQAAGTDEPENCGDEMDQQNNEIAHARIVTGQEYGRFSPNLRIRHQQRRDELEYRVEVVSDQNQS